MEAISVDVSVGNEVRLCDLFLHSEKLYKSLIRQALAKLNPRPGFGCKCRH